MSVNSSDAIRFSTNDVPLKDRYAVLRDLTGHSYLRLDLEPLGEAPVHFAVEQHLWGATSLTFAETNPLRSARTSELLRDGDGNFRFVMKAGGTRFRFTADGVDEVMNYGDAALLFNGVAGTTDLPEPCTLGIICIQRDLLAASVRDLDERPIRRVAAQSRALRLLNDYCAVLRQQGPSTEPSLAHQVRQHLASLVALALGPTEEARVRGESATRAARLAAIRADALTRLSEASLSARTVAARHGVSDRYVHQLFSMTGQTFSRFVEEERLKQAMALLTDPANASKRIGDVARAVGYPELSTFDRAFRRRFGDTPTGARGDGRMGA
ncbi:AraC family transcriptional regulator [Bradyrhizobium sp. NP1]|uniref:helix-turn-helix transcriptional regulator n=1 Tax=Bradyrhizobium sp. NP1 TaxID=3049772 RepID=UPI0025A67DB6|nr:AraC family transcriptional regulator [Bradyrhizobium sp. NP1]WJR77328.1 AraC family transcriptional regulator [Bradyrhizobium sp. NP1]